jgi:hypothetical protein
VVVDWVDERVDEGGIRPERWDPWNNQSMVLYLLLTVEIIAVSRCNMIYLFFSRFLTRNQSLWSVGEHEEVQGTLGRITRTTAVCCIASQIW